MHCTNCGSYIPPGARFCAGCGAAAVDPEMTRIARQQSSVPAANAGAGDVERTVFTTRPTLLFVKAGYVAAAAGALLLTALLAWLAGPKISALVAVPVAMALLLIPAYYHVRRNSVRYTLTDSDIEIDQGFVSRTTRNIPLRTIQDVTVKTSIPQRLLGYGNIIIDNASEQGGNVVLRNVQDPRHYANLLLREIRRGR
ncbi:MAG TPA: PH domain-containing protein [Pyrinomonadaceae bacterium]|jgi:membrane protein YdbS with pleckstrin-like domain